MELESKQGFRGTESRVFELVERSTDIYCKTLKPFPGRECGSIPFEWRRIYEFEGPQVSRTEQAIENVFVGQVGWCEKSAVISGGTSAERLSVVCKHDVDV